MNAGRERDRFGIKERLSIDIEVPPGQEDQIRVEGLMCPLVIGEECDEG